MIPQVFARSAFQPGHFGARAPPILVHPPHDGRQPGAAPFNEDEFQLGEFLECAFCDQADQVGHIDRGI